MRPLPGPLRDAAPVFVAPMASGASTPELVIAAAGGRHFAQLAAGYKTVAGVRMQVEQVRAAGVMCFGVNLFAPNITPVDPVAYRGYRHKLRAEADRLGLDGALPDIQEDDNGWAEKVELLLAEPVPVVSFTFGLPDRATVRRFQAAGSVTLQTVTTGIEAREASERGVDALVVQGHSAGGHSGVIDAEHPPAAVPLPELVRAVAAAVDRPIIASGGISSAADVRAALHAGAAAVAVGTAVLRCPESGALKLHKDALVDPQYDGTVLTRAFTGRPARALINRFVRVHDGHAPSGYPAVHHLTHPIRRAAAELGDPSALHLWAGEGHRRAESAPVRDILTRLTGSHG